MIYLTCMRAKNAVQTDCEISSPSCQPDPLPTEMAGMFVLQLMLSHMISISVHNQRQLFFFRAFQERDTFCNARDTCSRDRHGGHIPGRRAPVGILDVYVCVYDARRLAGVHPTGRPVCCRHLSHQCCPGRGRRRPECSRHQAIKAAEPLAATGLVSLSVEQQQQRGRRCACVDRPTQCPPRNGQCPSCRHSGGRGGPIRGGRAK